MRRLKFTCLCYQAGAINALKSQYINAIALHQDSLAESRNNNKDCRVNHDLFKEIEMGAYTHIFLSPEMVTNPRFDKLLRSKLFLERFRYFGIDEVHIAADWAGFRPKYDDLKRLRSRFPPSIVWFALSATVEPTHELPMLQKALGFSPTKTHVIRLPVDRRSIVLAPRFIQYPCSPPNKEFLDLSWVVSSSITCPEDIPITVVFVDELQQAFDVAAYLTCLLPPSVPIAVREQVVQQLTGFLTTNTEVIAKVRLGKYTRIIVSTNAGSVGLDIRQVERVVILFGRKSTTYKELCQKIGRIRTSGLAVLLFPRWMNINRTSTLDTKQRGEVEPVIVSFANATADRCPRRVNVDYWKDAYMPYDPKLGPCCNQHNPEVETEHLQEIQARASETKARKKAQDQAKKPGLRSDGTHPALDAAVMQPLALEQIDLWRHTNVSHICGYHPHMPVSVILSDDAATWLIKYMHLCTTFDRFREVMRHWSELGEWGESLYNWISKIWATFESPEIKGMIQKAQENRKSSRRNM
ncbi:hypothetical protein RSOLAG1IB_12176 [Rhizoctonia solani AG-1 IB]|uniref:DNA 3'-5' helicase n=1 Tax=Thanatephorus cucumeris (strain AG1-IB / isolate 7/3/14) TaxID=1108050 RepID=A0A0B7FL75_THACB|nr:hypothetical protein RSOLAG1IB_12176 [Rhizoctonia solani AG-1 IB]